MMPPTSYRDDFLKNGYAIQRECLPAWPLEGYEDVLKTSVPGVLWKTDPKGYLKEPALRALASCWEVGSLLMECCGEAMAVEQTACYPEAKDLKFAVNKSGVWAVLAVTPVFLEIFGPAVDGVAPVATEIDLKRGDVLVASIAMQFATTDATSGPSNFIWLSASGHNSRPDLPPAVMSDFWGWLFPTPAAEFV